MGSNNSSGTGTGSNGSGGGGSRRSDQRPRASASEAARARRGRTQSHPAGSSGGKQRASNRPRVDSLRSTNSSFADHRGRAGGIHSSYITAPPPKWENDRDHKCCKNCNRMFSVSLRRHHCRRCGQIFCSSCCYQRIRLTHIYGPSERVRVCVMCSCPLFKLDDKILQYMQLFLTYSSQDKLLRVCKRFQRLVIVPFPRERAITNRFAYKEPEDVLHVSGAGHRIIRATDVSTHHQRALRIVRKDSMYSRGDWQSLQLVMDTQHVLNHHAFPNLFEVIQTPEAIVLVTELIPSTYIPLHRYALEHKPKEIASCKVLYQLLDALVYLHNDAGLVHRNLNPATVLVDPTHLTIKLTGLSFAKRFRPMLIPSSLANVAYRSPTSAGGTGGAQSGGTGGAEQVSSPVSPTPLYSSSSGGSLGFSSTPSRPVLHHRHGAGSSTGSRGGGMGAVLQPLVDLSHYAESSTVFRYRPVERPIRRPPPIQVPRDGDLERKSLLYTKTAREREDHGRTEMEKAKLFTEPPTTPLMAAAEEVIVLCASPRGAPRFAAPEVVEMFASRNPLVGKKLTSWDLQKWDVFSGGVLLFFLLTGGKTPWQSTRWEVLALTMGDLSVMYNELPKDLTDPCKVLLGQTLAPMAEARCTARQALQSSVFAEETNSAQQAPPTAPTERRNKRKTTQRPFRT